MSLSIVWMSKDRARVFHLSDDKMQRDELDSDFDRLAGILAHSKRILILGKDRVGEQFRKRLQEFFPKIAACVVGCQESEAPSDQELASLALKYYV